MAGPFLSAGGQMVAPEADLGAKEIIHDLQAIATRPRLFQQTKVA
jgi:hypothetical protein